MLRRGTYPCAFCYRWNWHLCQGTEGKMASPPALRPSWASEIKSSTPCKPRSFKVLRNWRQCTSCSDRDTDTPRTSRVPFESGVEPAVPGLRNSELYFPRLGLDSLRLVTVCVASAVFITLIWVGLEVSGRYSLPRRRHGWQWRDGHTQIASITSIPLFPWIPCLADQEHKWSISV